MLKEIYVKDFILIDKIQINFENGMNAFTGETGAGKSLIIDAIALLKGNRATASLVRSGANKAIIEGVFEVTNRDVILKLENAGFDCEDNRFIVTREINADGKSLARINQRTTSLSFLKEVMSDVVDIHSQHDSQYLLNPRYHLHLLDKFINDETAINDIYTSFKAYDSLKKALDDALATTFNEDELAFLQFQVNEINEANLSEKEEDELLEEQKKMSAFEKLNSKITSVIEMLDGNTVDQLYNGAKELSSLTEFKECEEAHDKLLDLYYSLSDQLDELKSYLSSLEYDEYRFNEIQDRLFQINKLKRKYGPSISQILSKKQEMETKIDHISNRQQFIDDMNQKVDAAKQIFLANAHCYSEKRQQYAKELEKLIMNECKELYLEHAKFHISFNECEPSSTGIDQIEFMISMNPGEALKPLVGVASGGELSRLMLGMKTIFTKLQQIETVIFDEIDTGVSGKVAFAIGRKMQKIANESQVFAVTHLSSVAACANQQYLVEKEQSENETKTKIKCLDFNERVQVLASIASDSLSDSAIKAAEELLNKAQSTIGMI